MELPRSATPYLNVLMSHVSCAPVRRLSFCARAQRRARRRHVHSRVSASTPEERRGSVPAQSHLLPPDANVRARAHAHDQRCTRGSASSRTHLLAVLRDVLDVRLAQLLNGVLNGLHAAGLAHGLCRVVGVRAWSQRAGGKERTGRQARRRERKRRRGPRVGPRFGGVAQRCCVDAATVGPGGGGGRAQPPGVSTHTACQAHALGAKVRARACAVPVAGHRLGVRRDGDVVVLRTHDAHLSCMPVR